MTTISSRFCLLLLVLCICACAKKPQPGAVSQPPAETLADIGEFPQNLEVFARNAGAERRLIPASQQTAMAMRFEDIYFGPWQMRKSSISRRDVAAPFGRPSGFHKDGTSWTQTDWEIMRANANLASYPNRCQAAITLRPTDLREMPTHQERFAKPTPRRAKDPFDYFQYSWLPVGMPLLIAHTSKDGRWHYIECPIAGGWVDANDIGVVDEDFRRLWRKGKYAALVRENVNLPGLDPNGRDVKAGIGTILPHIGGNAKAMRVLAPVRKKNGSTGIVELDLQPGHAIIMPMPLTPGNVAQVGNQMLGQAYGWGGMSGLRDCSSMLRDLFAPFGVWLPRNSAAQARVGKTVRLSGMSIAEKERTILQDGTPFLSLVGLPGHITLYVGAWKNRPAIFHNAWGVRIIKDGDDDERYIIGKAVITSITPGMELPNLYTLRTFGDRVRSLNTPGH